MLRDFPARAPDSTRNTAAVPSDRSVTGPPGGGRAPRREVAGRLAGARVQDVLDPLHAGVRDLPQVGPLRQVLAQQSVGVPVQAPLPRVVGRREEEVGLQRLRHLRVPRELLAVIRRDRVDPGAEPLEKVGHRLADRLRLLSVNPLDRREFRASVHRRHHRTAVSPADHRVRFPVADSRLRPDLFRALRDVTPARVAATLPVRFLSPPPQVPARRSSVPAVRAYEVVYPLTADHAGVLQPETPRDLFRAPALLQLRHDLRPALLRQLPRDRRGLAPAPGGLPPRLSLPVSPPAAVASDLPRYGGRMAAQPPGDGPVRKPAFPRRVCPASFVEGQMTVALGHDTLLS